MSESESDAPSLSECSADEQESTDSDDEDVNIPEVIDLKLSTAGITAVKFHPSKAQLACGTTDGRVRIYDIDSVISAPVLRGVYHRCVRDVAFSADGNQILSVSNLGAFKIHDVRSGSIVSKCLTAHDCGINRVVSLNPGQFVTGDENGFVRLFDLHKLPEPVFSLHCRTDLKHLNDETSGMEDVAVETTKDPVDEYSGLCGVADILPIPGILLVACEDGTVTQISLNKRCVKLKSEFFSYPLTGIIPMKDGSKYLVSSEEGSCIVFNNGEFGNLCDRLCVAKKPIESICKISEDVAVCGMSNGSLEAVSLLPNACLGSIGRQPVVSGFCLRVSSDHTKQLVASSSPENSDICLWSCGQLTKNFDDLVESLSVKRKRKSTNASIKKKRFLTSTNESKETQFFSGLA